MNAYTLVMDASGNVTGPGIYMGGELPSPLPANEIPCTEAQAKNPMAYQVVNGQIIESLTAAQSSQTALLRSSCQTDITGGFMSSALGDIYNYPSGSTDQINLHTIAGNLHGGNLWCESEGVWSFKYHTQSQAQMVLSNFSSWLNTCQSKLLSLTEQVNNTTTVESVKAIVW